MCRWVVSDKIGQ